MTLGEAMKAFESAGTEQNRKLYRKHAFYTTLDTFGVSTANLQKIKKLIKTDHSLAQQLWATNNLDAQLLATMIADPKLASVKELDAWVKDIRFHMAAELFVRNLVVKTAHARSRMEAWTKSEGEFVAQAVGNSLRSVP